jgi:hypothetical protein
MISNEEFYRLMKEFSKEDCKLTHEQLEQIKEFSYESMKPYNITSYHEYPTFLNL